MLGCVLATFLSDAAPTGVTLVDAIYRSAFVVATVLAASRARRWSLVIASGLTIVGSTTLMLVPPIAAFVLAAVLAWRNKRDRVLGAVVGMLVGWSALNLVWPTRTGLTAAIAAAAVIPLWYSGYRVARTKDRRRIRLALITAAGVALLGVAISGFVVLTQRNVLTSAASETIDAAKGLTGASTEDSARKFAQVASRFESAASKAGAIWTKPARLVPIVSQNLDAVHQAAQSGAEVTRTAARIAGDVDYDRLQLANGGIDLSVLASFERPVRQAAATISTVDDRINVLDSPWILKPLRTKLDSFAEQTGPLRNGAEIASMAVDRLPEILGGAGERRYLMLLGNPAEARDLGGHIGTFAELTANNGVLDVVKVSSPYELFGPGSLVRPQFTDSAKIPQAMLEMNPTRFPQNWGASADMNVVGEVARQLYPQTVGGATIDGVIYADPYAFAAVLQLVGPVELNFGVATLKVTAENAASFLTRDQFILGDSPIDPAKMLVETALDRLTSNRLPAIKSVVDSFGAVVERGQLQLLTFDDDDLPLLHRTGLDQPFAQPKGGDLIAVINRSGFPSKIDSYLHRRIDYRLSWNPDSGAVEAQVEIELTNTAPAEGLPELIALSPEGTAPGTNRSVVSVVTPFGATGATVDGAELPIGTKSETATLKRHSFVVDIAPGATRLVRVALTGSVARGSEYRVRFYSQPLVNPDDSTLMIRSTGNPFIGGASSGAVRISSSGSLADDELGELGATGESGETSESSYLTTTTMATTTTRPINPESVDSEPADTPIDVTKQETLRGAPRITDLRIRTTG